MDESRDFIHTSKEWYTNLLIKVFKGFSLFLKIKKSIKLQT